MASVLTGGWGSWNLLGRGRVRGQQVRKRGHQLSVCVGAGGGGNEGWCWRQSSGVEQSENWGTGVQAFSGPDPVLVGRWSS